jgi:phage protein U
MMYAVLGLIEFQFLNGFTSFERTSGAEFPEHALINRKPRLQFTGQKLDEIKIELLFHLDFCDPEKELARLNAALAAHSSLPLVFGNGNYAGDFVITDISARTKYSSGTGTVIAQEISATLKEYTGDPAKPVAPAVRPAGKPLAIATLASPASVVASSLPGNVSGQVSGLALAVSTAKTALSTAAGVVKGIAALKAIQGNPVAVLGKMVQLINTGSNYLAVNNGVASLAGITKASPLPQAGIVLAGMSDIQTSFNAMRSFGNRVNSGNLLATLGQIDSIGASIGKSANLLRTPLAELAAKAATRGI